MLNVLIVGVVDCYNAIHQGLRSSPLSRQPHYHTTQLLVLDFSKAFDLVSHKKLLTKLDHYGVRGKTLNWLNGWISNRTQKVVIDGEFSPSIPVTSGVPQGTVLGPLMFLLYINDIGELIDNSTSIKLFADDCLLFRPIQTDQDKVQLQSDLDKLRSWAKSWQMNFNPPPPPPY